LGLPTGTIASHKKSRALQSRRKPGSYFGNPAIRHLRPRGFPRSGPPESGFIADDGVKSTIFLKISQLEISTELGVFILAIF